ncbi:hypothetical protein MG293_013271, partial [Ovis ammon polii]
VHQTKISFFINGLEKDNAAFDARTLSGSVTDFASGAMQIGQSLNGSEQFVGRMQDFRLYQVALTNREIQEVFSGDLPRLHIQSHCRCPGSHPRVHRLEQQYCIPSDAEDTTKNRVLRLNPEAHPLSFVNDNNIGTSWVSHVFTNMTQLSQGVTISIDLENGQYQLFMISNFINSFTPYSCGNVTFSILTPGQNQRPGYNNFYTTPSLQEFVKATQVRLHFHGQYHTTETAVSPRHRYYGVNEITITGRCQCYGHANRCDTTSQPYRCLCSQESFTEGLHCDRCLPLYNNKPFRQSDHVHAFNCKPCECNSHSRSCHYNISVDPFPLEHYRGGGGVCDDCEHNTAGKNCEQCKDYFFRQVGADPSAIDVCRPCDCDKVGTRNRSFLCDQIGGQCNCKRHVSGRQCNQCQNGFYNLQEWDPDGCSPCNCNTSGTVDGDITCHPNSGQCKCKANVIGLRCDHCNFGFKFLQSFNDDGCEPCQCNLHGSVNRLCNPLSGQCECKKEAKGLQCDTCREHFYGLDATGCKACDCDMAGSQSGTVCDAWTGQCVCKPNVGGRRCSECVEGYFYQRQNHSFLCLPCSCDRTGTINGSLLCDKSTGQCPCKLGVTGLHCNQCEPHRYNLTVGSFQGCQMCECDPLGTLPGNICDPLSGQCPCLPNRQGRRCNQCQPGNATGCLPCSCHTTGAVNHICNSLTGQCVCQDASIAGQSCDYCKDLYFGFDSLTGRCQPCNCHLSGALNETCHSVTGQCFCKRFVTGSKCDTCVSNASHLDISNPLGCSKNIQYFLDTALVPYTSYSYYILTSSVHGSTRSAAVTYRTKPGAPVGSLNLSYISPVSSDSVTLTWVSASNRSGPIEKYILSCAPLHGVQPCSPYEGPETTTTIWNLLPFTKYRFAVQACTSGGCLHSTPLTVITAQAAPRRLGPPKVRKISSTELHVEWAPPMEPNGIIIRYELYMKRLKSNGETRSAESQVFQSSGWLSPHPLAESANENALEPPETTTVITGLEPYTKYKFRVLAVNMAGSVFSAWTTGRTGESVSPLSPHSLNVSWEIPPDSVTRGKVVGYNINMISEQSPQWSHPVVVPQILYTAKSQELSYIVKGLKPYRIYNFTISLCNSVGCVTSASEAGQTLASGIKASFRTRVPEGLIVFAASPGNQEEYFAIQLKNGRPYFLFDPQGSAVEVTTTNDDGKQYSDGKWHEIIAIRHQGLGQITLDGLFTGSSATLDGGTVIGENTGVFVGGLPQGYTILRKDSDKMTLNQSMAYQLLAFTVAFGMGVYMELKSGILSFRLNTSLTFTQVDLWPGLSYCDGKWNKVIIKKNDSVISASMNELMERVSESRAQALMVNSPVYVGGIPQELHDSYKYLKLEQGFGGCMKDVKFARGAVINLASVSSGAVRVNLDGCLSTDSAAKCRGNDSILVYRGGERTTYESHLQPFTEYLYRVTASHEGGSVHSDWSRGRTTGAAPQSVPTPSGVRSINGYSIEVTWDEPVVARGVIEKYILRAYSEDAPGPPHMPSASSELVDTNTFTAPQQVQPPVAKSLPHSLLLSWNPPQKANGIITQYSLYMDGMLIYSGNGENYTVTDLAAFTPHQFLLSACTHVGCTNSSLVILSTAQLPPEHVDPPILTVLDSRTVYIQWKQPRKVNGILERYILYISNHTHDFTVWDVIYNNTELFQDHTLQYLLPGNKYLIKLAACTGGGCTVSKASQALTEERTPEGVPAPRVNPDSSHSFNISWTEPEYPNEITQVNHTAYCLTQSLVKDKIYILLKFQKVENRTLEAPPEGTVNVFVKTEGSRKAHVRWEPPFHPNGRLIYSVLFTGTFYADQVESTGIYRFMVGSHRLSRCSGNQTNKNPEGIAEQRRELNRIGQRSKRDSPDSVVKGKKKALYGLKNVSQVIQISTLDKLEVNKHINSVGDNYTLLNGTRIMHSGEETSLWVLINGLVPFTNYTVEVNASNSQGSLMSDPVMISMPPGAPDGVLPPRLSSATPTSLQVVWSTPARNNAPGSPRYQLQMRPGHSTHGFLELFSNPSASLNYEVRDLQPYTEYEFRLVASNGFGSAHSSWIPFITAEDKPGPVDPPVILDKKSRMMLVTWQHPLKCNGLITHYNIYQHGRLSLKTSGNVTNGTVTHLRPYTAYTFQVEACTSKGCSLSADSQTIWTLSDAPEGILSPELFSDTPTSVIISWQAPTHPNGLVENSTIQRRVQGKEAVTTLVTLPGSHPRRFIDKTSALSPWTKYEYRVLMSTADGGTNSSDWAEVTTRPSRPAGVQPPEVDVLGPDAAKVTWKPPLILNGDILNYEIRMPDPHITITNVTSVLSHVVTHLIPFTNYSVTIVACSGGNGYLGGCTESFPTHVTTPPALPQDLGPLSVVPLSESYVGISWQPPSRPNGPDLRYELLRCKIQQPLASNPPEDLNMWHNIYSGTQRFYEDKGLSRFTTYAYKVFVHNSVGFTSSQEVTVKTLAGLPERGANVTAVVLNHTAIDVRWVKPRIANAFQDLQGDVEYYTLFWSSATSNESRKILPDVNSHVIGHLNPNTEYRIFISVFNGVASINSEVLHATTCDGEPQGMLPPEVVIINSTAVRVIWTAPSNPNGVVTEYSVYVNNQLYKTGINVPGSFILRELSPFTVYDIQVEVCTKYACVKSNRTQITTVEDTPSDIPTPTIHGITSRSLQIEWMSPGRPSGIILGYDLLRKTWRPCSKTKKLMKDHTGGLCKAVECQKHELLCGTRCYSPEAKVCCNGALYDPQPGHACCEEKYIAFVSNLTGICCGGRIRETQPNHQCCSGYYVRILPGEVCCPDEQHNRVSAGLGNSCCGRMPYSTSGKQICCAGRLHDGHGQQCCGGQIVSKDFECCGGQEEGVAYSRLPGMFCCGLDYVNMSDTICCSASSGESKAHVKKNDPVPVKCCETELIPKSQECCNGVGYNPLKYVCSDKISTGMMMKETKACRTLCPASMEATAQCGRCDFNSTSHICTVIRGSHSSIRKDSMEEICSSAEETVHTGSVNTLSFTDVNLEPYMMYEYRISAWNRYGRGFSKAVRARTKEDVPEGVSPPRWTKMDHLDDVIVLSWKKPIQSNGPIIAYILLRNGIECFRGTSLSFSDTEGIQPFMEYSYQLKACTVAGCATSSKVVAATTQGIPQNIPPPRVTAPSAEALHVSWHVPPKPNGVIKEYQLRQVGKGLIYTDTTDRRQHTVTGYRKQFNQGSTNGHLKAHETNNKNHV